MERKRYPGIDMKLTGEKLKQLLKSAGYDVKYIQDYLHLSCPQPIYRWFKGKTLPSVDHLYALCILLGMHMEELLVPESQMINEVDWIFSKRNEKILLCYYNKLKHCA